MEKIHVLHLIYSLNTGGAERVIENYAKFHNRTFFEPVVCSLTSGGVIAERIKNSGVEVIMFNKKRGLDFGIIPKLIKVIRTKGIKVAHLHNFSANFWGTVASLIAGGVLIFRTEHTLPFQGISSSRSIKGLINILLNLFPKKIITVSDEVRKSYLKRDFIFSKKYITIHNGIDPQPFSITIEREKFFKEFGIKENQIVVGSIGNLTPQKGYSYLLQAAKLTVDLFQEVVFLLVGDGPLKKKLSNIVQELKLSDKVIFAGMRNDIPHLLKFIDIFVLSSIREGFSIALLEAMASGKPTVVTDVGGNKEAVVDGVTGYIVPPQNSNLLHDKILKLLLNRELADKMGKMAREHFLKKFTAQNMVKNTEAIYQQFL